MTTTKSDCDCDDTAYPLKSADSRKVTGSMTSGPAGVPGTAAPPAPAPPGGTVVLDGFQGLNPEDGLFLRADHLRLIQDYARSLSTALATASGPGVVHGLGVRLAEKTVEVSPGLAVSPRGRLLQLSTTVQIPLDDSHVPPRPPDGFWRVELYWATGTSGSAPVYGSLCNDTCADGGATIQPWRDEGVEIRIVADSLPGLDAVSFARRRNWLASAYFERERAGGQPWLVPVGAGSPVSLWSHDWRDSTPLPHEVGMPLAVLQSLEKVYDLDVWAARRLVDGSSANIAWRDRLAMRPWSVFLAQILQFETEVTGLTLEGPQQSANVYQEGAKDLLDEFQIFVETMKGADPVRTRHSFQRLEEVVRKTEESQMAAAQSPPMAAQPGLGELPPAGYLNVHNANDAVEGDVRDFFGPSVDLRIKEMRADQVADEVMAAQHRDRIPLEPLAGRRPQVDILVPAVPADTAESSTDAYGWVAFVRRGPEIETTPVPAPEAKEKVEVYLVTADDPVSFASKFTKENVDDATQNHMDDLFFPKGDWAYPGDVVARKVQEALAASSAASLVVLTQGDDRPLAAVRAGLFGTSLDSGGPLPVYAYGSMKLEAIVVVVGPNNDT